MPMNKNITYHLIALGIFVLLKFWMGTFNNDQLTFLLKPTKYVFELVTGSQSVYSAESGYFYNAFNIVIDKSCSGYNFLLLCFVMLYFQMLKYAKQQKIKLLLLIASFIGAYLLTILINSSRIIISVLLQDSPIESVGVEPHIIHESIGVVTYLSFLLITYFLTDNLLKKKYA